MLRAKRVYSESRLRPTKRHLPFGAFKGEKALSVLEVPKDEWKQYSDKLMPQ